MLAERGIDVSCETVRRWALKFGTIVARKLRREASKNDISQKPDSAVAVISVDLDKNSFYVVALDQ